MKFIRAMAAQPLRLLLCLSPTVAFSDDAATRGQEIFDKNQHAVVTVEVVLKASYSKDGQSAPSSETRYDLTGTVLDSSGLTAVAHSACDPAEFYKRVMPSYAEYKVESEITSVKILLEDNTEVPAEVVLRDKDLDLAFVRPKTALDRPMDSVNFEKNTTPKVLEQVVTLNRLNQASGRAYSACVERIIGVMKNPRPFFLHDGAGAGTKLGCPVFSLNGDVIGLTAMRVGGAMGEDYRENAASIIVPAREVLKAARQVPPMQKPATDQKPPSPSAGEQK
jgi:S1-C subfamily serine protease